MMLAPRYQHVSSASLTLAVHGILFAALMLSVSWKNAPSLPVQADLWADLPELKPIISALPEPVAPPPPPKAVSNNADIAVEKAVQEKKRQQAEALRAEELLKKQAEARQEEEKLRQEQQRQRQLELEREQARKQAEQEIARQAQAELEREQALMRARQERVNAVRRERVIDDFKLRIQAKVQSYVRVPPQMPGKIEAVFQVNLLANGEVREVKLVKPSGQPAYDVEVERAILKASPLPLPAERDAAAAFRGGLLLKFRPDDGGR